MIIGVGQYNHRATGLDDALEPVALMEQAVHAAAADAGLDGPPLADSVRVVNVIGWRYRNAPRFLAQRLGLDDTAIELAESTAGGNSPHGVECAPRASPSRRRRDSSSLQPRGRVRPR